MAKADAFIFVLGFISCAFLFYAFFYLGVEVPFISGMATIQNTTPMDRITDSDINVYPDKIVINVAHASLSHYAPTGSMKPVLDVGSNGIRIVPVSAEDINVGDIVSFNQSGILVVHRVVSIDYDEQGQFFITRGDNANVTDEKIRFSDIKFVTIGVLW